MLLTISSNASRKLLLFTSPNSLCWTLDGRCSKWIRQPAALLQFLAASPILPLALSTRPSLFIPKYSHLSVLFTNCH
ncbi:hypothetical protein L2E82_25400 [Cichorium intybus]|uniref:Uncharacterized protein n=1 Tax=Cichorium intybus TaxID=13427 RepID=A0ACB9E355_CICIN|nr:hypothetical protein L2E82_25400 [Cichorium intybus]